MQMVISTMVSGKMIKLTDMVNTRILMGHSMKEIGLMINSMDLAKNTGQTVLNTKETINSVKKMVMASFYGLINQVTAVTLSIIISMDTEDTDGPTGANIAGTGNAIRCMDKVYLHGLTVENMKDNTTMIRNKDTEYLPGQTVGNMTDIG